ncbi:helix-turn-helix domain-containing protein [Micromonospora sp. Llam7]|nr:helix-turn-helix domain-containing protein [Micromonospora tarapacensis]
MNVEPSPLIRRARLHAALGDPARLAIVDALILGDASPGEIARRLDLPTNLVAHHVKVLTHAGLVARVRSEGDRRRSYLQLRPEALATLVPPRLAGVHRVVFVCTHNSARSQLAAALWRHRTRGAAASAGTKPAARVHPRAIAVAHHHQLDLDPAHPVSDKPSVLFVCVHNAGRSQMAAGWLRHLAGDTVEVRSAGSAPAETVNPAAVEAMREVGIDITDQSPKLLEYATAESSDVIITMGCGDACPVFPGKRYEDWKLADPAGKGVDAVRPIRDEIRTRVEKLLTELPAAA